MTLCLVSMSTQGKQSSEKINNLLKEGIEEFKLIPIFFPKSVIFHKAQPFLIIKCTFGIFSDGEWT